MATITTTTNLSFDAAASLTVGVDKNFDGSIEFTSANDDVWPSFTVTKPQSKTYGPFGIAMTAVITVGNGSLDYTINGGAGGLAYDSAGAVIGSMGASGDIIAVSEVTDYVNLTATGTAFTGACEFAGYICTVAAGNITVYDNTSASGTVIVPTTALAVGAFPIFGAGTNGKMALTTGCHVVLSGAGTVNVLVG